MQDHLKFGLTSMNMGATSYPDALVRVAQAAETAGFDSLWAGEHSVLAAHSRDQPHTEPGSCPHIRGSAHTHRSPGHRHSASPSAPSAHPGQGTGQPGCPFRWPVDRGDWRRLGCKFDN